jgi:hypothetical protein
MRHSYSAVDEEKLIDAYCREVKPSFSPIVRRHLHYLCRTFRKLHPGDSLLHHTRTTQWVHGWQRQHEQTLGTQAQQLGSLGRWWSWLLKRQVVNENVLDFVCLTSLVHGKEPVLTLPTGLHRLKVLYEEQLMHLAPETRRMHRLTLRYYVRFVAMEERTPAANVVEAFGEQRLHGWIIFQRKRSGRQGMLRHARHLSGFTKYLFDMGHLLHDPVRDLIHRFPLRGCSGVVDALGAPDPQAALNQLAKPPRFQSSLASRFHDFVQWKRLMGCKYKSEEIALADFDRFLAKT